MPNIAVIANAKSRGGAGWVLCQELLKHKPHIKVYLLGDDSAEALVAQAAALGCETIVAAGGDGTISSVADAILRHGGALRLGVLPAGTLNHFAQDMRIPLDLSQALEVIEGGHTTHIDLARVNQRHFINNSSIGFYPKVVEERRKLERLGVNGWIAFFYTILRLGIRRPAFMVSFGKGQDVTLKKTSSIFIGNNKYIFNGLTIGARARLDEGLLFVAIIRHMAAQRAAALASKILRGTLFAARDINATGLAECTITSKNKKMLVSIDGEIAEMETPLHYAIVPKGLRVIIPK